MDEQRYESRKKTINDKHANTNDFALNVNPNGSCLEA